MSYYEVCLASPDPNRLNADVYFLVTTGHNPDLNLCFYNRTISERLWSGCAGRNPQLSY